MWTTEEREDRLERGKRSGKSFHRRFINFVIFALLTKNLYLIIHLQSRDGLQFANIEELLLQRLDHLDDMTRMSLHFAAILGMSFKFDEMLEVSLRINSNPSSGSEAYKNSLKNSIGNN